MWLRRIQLTIFGATVLLTTVHLPIRLLNHSAPWTGLEGRTGPWHHIEYGITLVAMLASAAVGWLISSRHPRNAVGWLLLLFPAFVNLSRFLEMGAYLLASHAGAPSRGPITTLGPALTAWVASVAGTTAFYLFGTFLFMLFPTGSLPSRRWRPLAVGVGAVVILAIARTALQPRLAVSLGRPVENPFGVNASFLTYEVLVGGRKASLADVAVLLAFSPAVAPLLSRLRARSGDERQQVKWFAAASSFLAVSVLSALTFYFLGDVLVFDVPISGLAFAAGVLMVPLAAGVAIFKYRLYDIDVVINRAIVYGTLALFISVGYVAVSAATPALLGSRGLLPSVASMGVVAVAFAPIRLGTQDLANRIVYGKRARARDVLVRFSQDAGSSLLIEDLLARVAEAAARGVAAQQIRVTLRVPDGSERVEIYPPEAADPLDDPSLSVAITYRDEEIGRLDVYKRRGEGIGGDDRRLLENLVRQTAAALQNVRMTAEIEARLAELERVGARLEETRRRLVSAQFVARRALEKDVRARVAPRLDHLRRRTVNAKQLPYDEAASKLEEAAAATDDALEELREIAHGIFPAVLDDKGIVAALESRLAKTSASGRVVAAPEFRTQRFEPTVEAAVYFCCARSAAASPAPVDIRLVTTDEHVHFEITGRGDLDPIALLDDADAQHMSDRLEAIGGEIHFRYAPGRSPAIIGRVPAVHP